jgi:hypothetical protein
LGQKFEIHLIIGIPDEIEHYVIPGSRLLEDARPEVSWYLPTTKYFKQYKIDPVALHEATAETGLSH